MKNIARSLRQAPRTDPHYFRAQKLLSSGVVEGLNNKAKVTMRKSYGFRTFRCLELALGRRGAGVCGAKSGLSQQCHGKTGGYERPAVRQPAAGHFAQQRQRASVDRQ